MKPENSPEKTAGVQTIPELNKSMEVTFNYIKHSSKHPFRRWMIDGFYETVIKGLGRLEISTVLDVGCGEGFTLDRLVKAEIGDSLIGIDRSRTALRLGLELFPELNLMRGDIYNLPLEDCSMDLVVCTEVLEHLKGPQKALKELVRVSKKYLLLSVPNEPFFSLRNLVMGKNIARLGSPKGHINFWTSREFCSFVRQQRVRINKTKHPFPFTLLFLQKI